MLGNFRGHIAGGARNGAGTVFHGHLGHAKVAQLINTCIGNQNVFRLDIPMDDMLLFAGNQGIAQACAQLQDGFLRVFRGQNLFQRCQQLHADIQVPADAIVMLNIAQVQTVDDVGAAA